MNALTNKVALVKGSARGLGQAIAERYAALGASVVVNYARNRAASIFTEGHASRYVLHRGLIQRPGLVRERPGVAVNGGANC